MNDVVLTTFRRIAMGGDKLCYARLFQQ